MSKTADTKYRLKKYFRKHYDSSSSRDCLAPKIRTLNTPTTNISNSILMLEHPKFGEISEDNPIKCFIFYPRITDILNFEVLRWIT